MAIVKYMVYDKVDLVLDSEEKTKRVSIGYILMDGILAMWSIKKKTCFPERPLFYDSMILIGKRVLAIQNETRYIETTTNIARFFI